MAKLYVAMLLVILLLISAIPLIGAAAQGQPPIKVVMTNTDQGLALDFNLVVRDAIGNPIEFSDITSISFKLYPDNPDEEVFSGRVSPVQSRIKIALLLDESGSMSSSLNDVRSAILSAIGSAPEQADIAIFKFSNTPPNADLVPDLDFTPDREAARQLVSKSYSASGDATCLYNATSGVLDYLDKHIESADRRAIILFTDGENQGAVCGDGAPDPIITQAQESDTPIYTVGLCLPGLDKDGRCLDKDTFDEKVLRAFAEQTGALAKVNNLSGLTGAFVHIMDDLKAQVAIHTELKPCSETTVIMEVQVAGPNTTIKRSSPIPISSSICYTPRATITELPEPSSTAQESRFQVRIHNSSTLTLTTILADVIPPSNQNPFSLSIDKIIAPGEELDFPLSIGLQQLTEEGEYTLKLRARAGQVPFLRAPGVRVYANDIYQNEDLEVIGKRQWTPTLKPILPKPSILEPIERVLGVASGLTVTLRLDGTQGIEDLLDKATYSAQVVGGGCKLIASPLTAQPVPGSKDTVTVHVPFDSSASPAEQRSGCQFTMMMALPPDPRLGDGKQSYRSEPSNLGQIAAAPPSRGFPWLVLLGVLMAIAGTVLLGRLLMLRRRAPSVAKILPPKPYNDATMLPETVLHLRIIETSGQRPISEQVITTFPFVIGRTEGDLILRNDLQMTKKHLRIERSGKRYKITDLTSKNGTTVNGQPLPQGGSIEMTRKTTVRLGTNTLIELTPEE